MPVHLTISHPHRLVVAVAKETLTLADIERYLDAVVVDGALGYRKIFDMTNARPDVKDAEMMLLGARISAYASTNRMGPIAIVASTDESYDRARLFGTLAAADRPLEIFRELHAARKWLDGLPT